MGGTAGGNSGMQFFPGQQDAIKDSVFNEGGIFSQFLAGKPNAGFERAQQTGLQQIQQRNSQLGLSQQPLGTRLQTDYLTKSNQAAGDNFMDTLFQFMQPAGSQSKTRGLMDEFNPMAIASGAFGKG